MSSALQTLAKGSAISFIAMIFLGATNYLIRRTLALNLSEVEYGFFYAAFSFCSLFLAYLDLGLGKSTVILMTKYSSQKLYDKANEIFSLVTSYKLFASLLIVLPLFCITPYLAENYFCYPSGEDDLYLFWLIIPLISMSNTCYHAFDSKKDFLSKNVLNVVHFFIILVAVLCLIDTYQLRVVVLAFAFTPVITFALGKSILSKRHSVYFLFKMDSKKERMKEIFHFSKWVALSVAGMSTMTQMDTQMLLWFKGLENVALYNIALPIQQILYSFMFLPQVFTPIATDLWHSKKTEELGRICSLFINLTVFAGGALILTLISTRDLLIIYLFDEKYLAAQFALIILCSGVALLIMGQFFMSTLNSIGAQKKVSIIIILGVLVNVCANAVFIPMWGINGAAFSTSLSYLVIVLLTLKELRKVIPVAVHVKKISYVAVVAATLGVVSWELKQGVSSELPGSILLVLGNITVYAVLIAAIMKDEISFLLKKITRK